MTLTLIIFSFFRDIGLFLSIVSVLIFSGVCSLFFSKVIFQFVTWRSNSHPPNKGNFRKIYILTDFPEVVTKFPFSTVFRAISHSFTLGLRFSRSLSLVCCWASLRFEKRLEKFLDKSFKTTNILPLSFEPK